MPVQYSSQAAVQSFATSFGVGERSIRKTIARLAIGAALATGLGCGVASTHATGAQRSVAHLSVHMASVSSSVGVTGGPGNG